MPVPFPCPSFPLLFPSPCVCVCVCVCVFYLSRSLCAHSRFLVILVCMRRACILCPCVRRTVCLDALAPPHKCVGEREWAGEAGRPGSKKKQALEAVLTPVLAALETSLPSPTPRYLTLTKRPCPTRHTHLDGRGQEAAEGVGGVGDSPSHRAPSLHVRRGMRVCYVQRQGIMYDGGLLVFAGTATEMRWCHRTR